MWIAAALLASLAIGAQTSASAPNGSWPGAPSAGKRPMTFERHDEDAAAHGYCRFAGWEVGAVLGDGCGS